MLPVTLNRSVVPMRRIHRLATTCLALAVLGFGAGSAAADASCRIAFDIGSSGIRAGLSGPDGGAPRREHSAPHADIDYLGPQWAGQGLAPVVAPTAAALRDLPEKAGFPSDCVQVGAGFSAWRLALKQDDEATVAALARIRAESGVPVLVIPQPVEGGYGYAAARASLGDRLPTSHVLDIGGGSLQIAGAGGTFGLDLGQKAWHRLLCTEVRRSGQADCDLQPLSARDLAKARALLRGQLAGARTALPAGLSLTAISRPVTRGVFPAVARLADLPAAPASLTREQIATAIARLAAMPADEAVRRLDTQPKYLRFLLSDLLLVEGVLAATGSPTIAAADVDLTNLPALLTDDQAYAWGGRYACYLSRLKVWGAGAYYTDPATCPAP